MRIVLKNGESERNFIVKIKYDMTKPMMQKTKDEFSRDVYTVWREKKTTVTCHEWDPVKEPISRTIYEGTTTCHYTDAKRNYSKAYGKSKAWDHCVEEMVKNGVLTGAEGSAMVEAGLKGCIIEVNMNTLTSTILK